ncbi:MAG: polysaccharide biosynthesis protein [Ferruginibacter sp.]|nr:polysaccharide biosynthesis protein [Ferruginibacter sp.]
MSQIRKRSLKATSWIYAGFLIGAINVYFLTHKDWFTPDQNGLTRAMLDVSLLICGFSTVGVTSYIIKFFPYYQDNSENKHNDLLGTALKIALSAFVFIGLMVWLLQPLIVQKFGTNSRLLVDYILWTIPMAFSILLFNILEAYAYNFQKGIFTSLLKECVVRLYTLVIILLKVCDLISFHLFVILFALQYVVVVLLLAGVLYKEGNLWIHFKISPVTSKYRRKIFSILALTSIVVIVNVLRGAIDGLLLAAKQDLAKAGIFSLASYFASVLQAPLRSLVAITIPILSRAWKDKNHREISRIYKRSSINLLCFALFFFFCIWLNFDNGIAFFGINPAYLEGKWVFFLLGMVTIIEMGTGVNGQIIGTSNYWRFELWTSLLLTALIIPLSYFLTVRYGIFGPAIANLVSFTIYNAIRFWFLWKKFHMQPFSYKTLEILLISVGAYFVSYFCFKNLAGLTAIFCNLILFTSIFVTGMYTRNISPDVKPVLNSLTKRFRQ